MVETLKRNTLDVIPLGQWGRSSAGKEEDDDSTADDVKRIRLELSLFLLSHSLQALVHLLPQCLHVIKPYFLLTHCQRWTYYPSDY